MRWFLAGSLLVVTMLTACDVTAPATPPPVATPTPMPTATRTAIPPTVLPTATAYVPLSVRLQPIDDAEKKWLALGITNYQITFREEGSFNRTFVTTVEVRNGVVDPQSLRCSFNLGSTCSPQSLDGYTVAGAFQRARQTEQDACCNTVISYDSRYFFPSSIWCFASPNCADAQRSTSVMLTVLP